MAKLRQRGDSVAVVCATRGQRGATADVCSVEELPQVRETELRTALRLLNVNDLEFYPYQDKQLGEVPVDDIRPRLVASIRRTRPDVVLTFDPHGGNLHPDHVAISRFVSDALSAAADARWFPESGPPHTVDRLLWQPPVPLFQLPEGTDLSAEPGFDFLVDVGPWSESKVAAMRAHRTQVRSLSRIFFDNPHFTRLKTVEVFRLAWGRRPATSPAPDIFA